MTALFTLTLTEKSLVGLADELTIGIEVRTLQVDFREVSKGVLYERIEQFLAGMDVGVLVNNVGHSPMPKRFLDHADTARLCHDMLNVNVLPLIRVRPEFLLYCSFLQLKSSAKGTASA